ncbi:MAG: M60 family metallopeptidase [Oscillospiraceae bacterium]|nr:M60 family metallopeptidase [Oscillospiraceae bacterium]
MKKRELFKKQIASLLALCMVSNFFISAGAVDAALNHGIGLVASAEETQGTTSGDTPQGDGGELGNNGDEGNDADNNNGDDENQNGTVAIGRIDVSVSMALFIDNADFTVSLLDVNGDPINNEKSVQFTPENKDAVDISFSQLPDGNYTLQVTGNGFQTYEQEITVEGGKRYTLQLTAGFCGGYVYDKNHDNQVHPGVLLIGDADGSCEIDAADRDYLVDLIHEGVEVNEENKSADLNGDGDINIEDLMFFAKGYLEELKNNTEAYVEKSISPDAVTADIPENITVTGNVEDILNGEGKVTFEVEGTVSDKNPITVGFDVNSEEPIDGVSFGVAPETPIEEAFITVETAELDENDNPVKMEIPLKKNVHFSTEFAPYAELDSKGNIQVHLGTQIAVKKVSLKVTAVAKANGEATNLVTIAKTEFVNGMESRMPEPEITMPENVKAVPGSDQFTVSWKECLNVTGYEVVVKEKDTGRLVKTISTATTSAMVGDNNHNSKAKLIKNLTTYQVTVQAVNGTWRSAVSEPVEVTPMPSGKPDMVNNVSAVGAYKKLTVKWNPMPDTTNYRVYYKLRGSNDEPAMAETTKTECLLEDLEDKKEYELYVIGSNAIGDAPPSLTVFAQTGSFKPVAIPTYGAINLDENGKLSSNHIVSTKRNTGGTIEGGDDDPIVLADRENKTAWATLDGDIDTFYKITTWDDGGYNKMGTGNGLTYEFDQEYNLGGIAFSSTDPFYARLSYWDEAGNSYTVNGRSVKTDVNGQTYYTIDIPDGGKAKKVQFAVARYWWDQTLITVHDVVFYEYNDLLKRTKALFADQLHSVLRDDVTVEMLDALYEEANTPDEFGNYNLDRTAVNNELDWAYKIINAEDLGDPITIHPGITNNGQHDPGRGFSGLNAWQPMGINVANNEKITIYVGSDKREYGENAELTAVVAQYHTESGKITIGSQVLKVGENDIQFAVNNRGLAQEEGGMLYIAHSGGANNSQGYSIRISGGTEVPVLDLYGVKDHNERVKKAATYIKELDEYVTTIPTLHEKKHEKSDNKFVNNREYDEQNCIFGGTEILLDSMLYSLPAKQILAGLGNGSAEARAEKLVASMDATDEMMYLFYQHKGLNDNGNGYGKNHTPQQHQNIRYMRQFENSFMYAAGNHIGIEWGSVPAMATGKPNFDAEGNYTNNGYFGWGIAHEVGHCLDQGAISMPEITNNYFAELAHGGETNNDRRFKYSEVYKKVSSGQKGASSNVATQLALYWQLHIAYDKDPNYTTYSDYNTQLANLFYARLCKISRDGNVTVNGTTVNIPSGGDKDQTLMRLGCAAAGKDILDFFKRWGKEPNADTIKFAENFPKETRAIWYANDDSRNYVREQTAAGNNGVLGTEQNVKAIETVAISKSGLKDNEINLVITSNGTVPANEILGYEIVRCTIEGGQAKEAVVGFTQDGRYTDVVSSMNNRTVSYKVILVDKFLNRSAAETSDMVKIHHEGEITKVGFQITAKNWMTDEGKLKPVDEIDDEHDVTDDDHTDTKSSYSAMQDASSLALDNNYDTVYKIKVGGIGNYAKAGDPKCFIPEAASRRAGYFDLTIDFGKEYTIQGFKVTDFLNLTTPESNTYYEVFVQYYDKEDNNKAKFTEKPVATGKIDSSGDDSVYFTYKDEETGQQKYVCAYETSKLLIKFYPNWQNDEITIAEFDVLTPTGDNVEFRTTTDKSKTLIGTMGADYVYDKEKGCAIPEGSLVFTGQYKGNPAYNVVLLFDENGDQVMGFDATDNSWVADQTILANVPEGGTITDVANGTWIYWIEPDYLKEMELPKKVRAELYRVDDPITNAGQRLVSDSLFEELTTTEIDKLPKITFGE